jgi:hypothetical protein
MSLERRVESSFPLVFGECVRSVLSVGGECVSVGGECVSVGGECVSVGGECVSVT